MKITYFLVDYFQQKLSVHKKQYRLIIIASFRLLSISENIKKRIENEMNIE
jgi:hypothetical protein